jgi:hypothetical protein
MTEASQSMEVQSNGFPAAEERFCTVDEEFLADLCSLIE